MKILFGTIIFNLINLICSVGYIESIGYQLKQVDLYSLLEIRVENNTAYLNPFDLQEIEIIAKFTSPSAKKIEISGFFDGDGDGRQTGNVWKIRFMPNEIGKWEYVYSWSDGTPGGSGIFFVKNNRDPKKHGHVHIDSRHPKYLIYDDGSPHYWWGACWISASAYGPPSKGGQINNGYVTNAQFIKYLDTLEKYRHNGLLINIGLFPLEDDKLSWDIAWINRAEWLVRQMYNRGIYAQINIFNTWSRGINSWDNRLAIEDSGYISKIKAKIKNFFSNKSGWKAVTDGDRQVLNVWKSGNEHAKKNYIRTIIARFAGFPNVYWELGNEMGHSPNSGDDFVAQANENYIPWIQQYDPYDLPIGLSEDIWKKANVDIGFLHQTHRLPNSSYKKPTIMNELVRGGFKDALWKDSTIRDRKNRLAYRRTFWQMFTYGGCGSSEATWLKYKVDLNQAVLDVMGDQQRLRKFVETLSTNINQMDPDSGFVISGPGKFSTRCKKGTIYVSYFLLDRSESATEGTVNVSLPKGGYDYTWFNPQNGLSSSPSQIESAGRTALIKHPSFKEDIVLKIVKSH